jgi:hypothetical protein
MRLRSFFVVPKIEKLFAIGSSLCSSFWIEDQDLIAVESLDADLFLRELVNVDLCEFFDHASLSLRRL